MEGTKELPSRTTGNINPKQYKYWEAKVNKRPKTLAYAPYPVRNDKTIVMLAVRKDWRAFQFASSELRNEKEITMAAVRKSYLALKFASPELRDDEQVIMAAIQSGNHSALGSASPRLRNDKQIVMSAVRKDGKALRFASPELKNDRQVVMAAVQRNGGALIYASQELQNNKEVVLAAVKEDGRSFRFASRQLQDDKEVIVVAVNRYPDNIQGIRETMKMDRDVLIAAGMFDEDHKDFHSRQEQKTKSKKIAFSTRFSLSPTSWSQANNFTSLLKKSKFIQDGDFIIYAPNAFNKKTCDPSWTNFCHPCRGTKKTCRYNNKVTAEGHPTDDCCWRYSFRSQLVEARSTGGFMLQLVETGRRGGCVKDATLGNGQRIELDMAKSTGTKVFQVYCPQYSSWRKERYWRDFGDEEKFDKSSVDAVTKAISRWHRNQCQDMSVTVIRPKEFRF